MSRNTIPSSDGLILAVGVVVAIVALLLTAAMWLAIGTAVSA